MPKTKSLPKMSDKQLGPSKAIKVNLHSDEIIEAFHAIVDSAITIESYTNKLHKNLKIRQPSISIINALFENGGTLPQKRLVKHLGRTRQATALALSKLERSQIISREEADNDRRKRIVSLTAKGWALAKKIRPSHDRFFDIFTSCINKNDRGKTAIILRTLIESLNKDIKKFNQPRPKSRN